jgi:hypothetical protein
MTNGKNLKSGKLYAYFPKLTPEEKEEACIKENARLREERATLNVRTRIRKEEQVKAAKERDKLYERDKKRAQRARKRNLEIEIGLRDLDGNLKVSKVD